MANVAVANTSSGLSGKTVMLAESDQTVTGLHTYSRSTSAPFAVNAGAAKVDNLDADKLDGQTGSYYNDPANLSSVVPLAKGGTGAALVDPNADRLLFWDDSAGAIDFLTPGTGLTITTTTMTASASSITAYTATVADVVSTASITTTISWTNTLAVADGDEIEVRCLVELKNNKGSSGSVTQTLGFGGVTQAWSGGAATWADNATARVYVLTYRFVRYGADMYVALGAGTSGSTTGWNSFDDMNTASNTVKITAPTLTAGQTGLLRITLSASDANFYWKTKSARVRHYT